MATLAFRDGTEVDFPAELVEYSLILSELPGSYDDNRVDMMCGTSDDARRAIRGFETIVRILPGIATFNAPSEGTPLEELEELRLKLRDAHAEIVELTRENEVYEWLALSGDAAKALRTLEDESFPFSHLRDKNLVSYVYHARWSFEEDCVYRGCLPVGRWLYSLRVVDLWLNGPWHFERACAHGNLAVAQWLYGLEVDVHHIKGYAFRSACERGHLPTAQWLYRLGGIDIHRHDDWAYQGAFDNKHDDVVGWLRELGCEDSSLCFARAQ
jgi:hypothetical protein